MTQLARVDQDVRDAPVVASGRGETGAQRAGTESSPLRDRSLFVLSVVGRAYRALLLSLVATALVPALWGWSSYLVRSGSMEPAIAAGDVVVARSLAPDARVPVGRVMLFRVPDPGGGTSLRVHRVVSDLGDGTFATAGDANRQNDADPVPRDQFESRALLRVPYVGLPMVWLSQERFVALAAWLVGSVALLLLSFRPVEEGPPPRRRPRRPRRRTSWARRRARGARHQAVPQPLRRTRRLIGLALVAGMCVALVSTSTGVDAAAFSAVTRNDSNAWRVGSVLQPYTAAVMLDSPYQFYRLDDSSGTVATDSAGSAMHGSYAGVAAYGQPGALPNNPAYSIRLAGSSGRMVAGGPGLYDPHTYSVELWFRTTTSAGGKLIGFEDTRNATSTFYDRAAVMRTDGRVAFVGATFSGKQLLSPSPLNNGAWHHLVITAAPQGSQDAFVMYVDGVQVDARTSARPLVPFTGWWRVGYGRVPVGTGFPSTGNFTGWLDDVAVYRTQLSAARVAAHYAAR